MSDNQTSSLSSLKVRPPPVVEEEEHDEDEETSTATGEEHQFRAVLKGMEGLAAAVNRVSDRMDKLEAKAGQPSAADSKAQRGASADAKEAGPLQGSDAIRRLDGLLGARRSPAKRARSTARRRKADVCRRRASSPSSGSDSGSSESPYERRHHRRRPRDHARDHHDLDGRLAPELLRRIHRRARTASEFVRRHDWDNTRSSHEARRIAQVVDQALAEGITTDSLAMEMLLRNLTGLYEADVNRNPPILAELEWEPPEELIPRSVMRTVLKDAERRAKFDAKAKKTKPRPASQPKDDKKDQGGAGGGRRQ